MNTMKIMLMIAAFIGLSVFSVAQAAEQGQMLKLIKPAKMHIEASGPSEVSEVVWQGKMAVQLGKSGVWVQVRMQESGHTGWVHEKYLEAVTPPMKAEVVPIKVAAEVVAAVPVVEPVITVEATPPVAVEPVVEQAAELVAEITPEQVAEDVVPAAPVVVEAAVIEDAVADAAPAVETVIEQATPVAVEQEGVADHATAPAEEHKPAAKEKSSGHHGAALQHANVDVTDQAQIRRGLTVFTDVCMGCHSAKYITYRGLIDYPEIGLSREAVDELRGDKSLMSGMISDLTIEDAVLSYGKAPPDLSLVVPGRRGGADYIYSLLIGYQHDPDGKVPDGNFNAVFTGNRIAMPDPLSWLDHEADETAELKQQAEDVSAFLAFVADPHQNTRRSIGFWVMGFLLLLTFVLWRLKVEVWKDVKH